MEVIEIKKKALVLTGLEMEQLKVVLRSYNRNLPKDELRKMLATRLLRVLREEAEQCQQ